MNDINERDIVICGAARTPTGKFSGALLSQQATDLGAIAVKAALERSQVDLDSVYEVIMGNVVSAGLGQAPARQVALHAGLSDSIGATTINKVCGSGLKAVMLAANAVAAGEAQVFVAGGMESMSNAPYLLPKARHGLRYGHSQMQDSILHDGLWCSFQDWGMGNGAEFIAQKYDISRQAMDQYSFDSQCKAAEATIAGRFQDEIVPVEIHNLKGSSMVTVDEPIRATFSGDSFDLRTSLEQLAKLPPAFVKDGRVTAGNAPGLNDGAAALLITSRREAIRQGMKPMARIVGYTLAGVDPQWIFSAPAKAMPKLLDKIGWSFEDVDLIELNEAFAAQVLANGAELSEKGYHWDWKKVNVNGGAIALGHPIGASGARILVTLLYALITRNLERGIAALCLGGGEAVAMAVEVEDQ